MNNDNQQSKRGFIFYMVLMVGLFMLLLTACEPVNIKTITKLEVTNNA